MWVLPGFMGMTVAAMGSGNGLDTALTLKEAFSGIFGSVSLATWIFLLVPQLLLNFKTKNAEGISLVFLSVWLIGDIANLSGAIWAGLVPTVIALAIYFCIADVILISQCVYYNTLTARQRSITASTENEPLLRRRSSSMGLPGSNRRQSELHEEDTLSKILEEGDEGGSALMKNSLSVVLVVLAGAAGWAIAWRSGVWTPTPEAGEGEVGGQAVAVGASVLGYFSAVCYLGARIPQIVKNHREKSCDGLSLLFFLLSLMGNLTYGAQILCHSLERDYIITNLPWLIGSLGTMAEDAFIFVQFRLYGQKKDTASAIDG